LKLFQVQVTTKVNEFTVVVRRGLEAQTEESSRREAQTIDQAVARLLYEKAYVSGSSCFRK